MSKKHMKRLTSTQNGMFLHFKGILMAEHKRKVTDEEVFDFLFECAFEKRVRLKYAMKDLELLDKQLEEDPMC